jgi:hypothetical protein
LIAVEAATPSGDFIRFLAAIVSRNATTLASNALTTDTAYVGREVKTDELAVPAINTDGNELGSSDLRLITP